MLSFNEFVENHLQEDSNEDKVRYSKHDLHTTAHSLKQRKNLSTHETTTDDSGKTTHHHITHTNSKGRVVVSTVSAANGPNGEKSKVVTRPASEAETAKHKKFVDGWKDYDKDAVTSTKKAFGGR
jgi:hypothetical protein